MRYVLYGCGICLLTVSILVSGRVNSIFFGFILVTGMGVVLITAGVVYTVKGY